MDDTELAITYAVLVVLSAAASIARESLLRVQAARRGVSRSAPRAGSYRAVLGRSDQYLLTILIVNHLAKLASVCVLFVLLRRLQVWPRVLVTLMGGSAVILLGAELLPRHVARAHPEASLRALVPALRVLHLVVYPLTWAAGQFVRLLKRAFGIDGSIFPLAERPHALLELIEASNEADKLRDDDRELITSIFEFRDTIVREVMVPRVDMVCVEDAATLADAHRLVVDKGHSRVPVYHDNVDAIVGVLYAKDLLRYAEQGPLGERKVAEVVHEPMYVPETKKVAELLREFQQKRLHLAIVVDEYGGTAGLVTIEDLLEEIVGEIRDEYDTELALYQSDARGGFIVDAKMPISELEDALGIALPEDEEYDTVGGYIVTRLGKVPSKDEVFSENGVQIAVLEADERRIHKVRLVSLPTDETPPDEPAH